MAFRVANWAAYENAASRKVSRLRWVAFDNDLNRLCYRRIVGLDDGPSLWGAWAALLSIASAGEGQDRGRLTSGGRPIPAADLALLTSMPADLIERALDILSTPEIGLVERFDLAAPATEVADSPAKVAEPATEVADSPAKVEGKNEGSSGVFEVAGDREETPLCPPSGGLISLPRDFFPDSQNRALLRELGLNLEATRADFRRAMRGGRATPSDWQHAFEDWARQMAAGGGK